MSNAGHAARPSCWEVSRCSEQLKLAIFDAFKGAWFSSFDIVACPQFLGIVRNSTPVVYSSQTSFCISLSHIPLGHR